MQIKDSQLLPVALSLIHPLHMEPLVLSLKVVVLKNHAVEQVRQLTVHHDQVQPWSLAAVLGQESHAQLLHTHLEDLIQAVIT